MPTKTPRTVTVPIVLDPAAEKAVLDAKNALNVTAQELLETFSQRVAVRAALEPDADAARAVYDEDQEKLAELTAALDNAQAVLTASVREYAFRPLGWKAWRALKAAHPSKDKDYAFDVDSIAPTLLRDASHEPKLSAADVEDILTSDEWSEGEVILLINAAVTVQS